MRVMGDEICYPAKEYLSIHKLFSARADLHRTVYTHSKVKSIELMAVDALVKANGYLKISSYPFDPAEYWKFCNEYAVPKEKLEHFKNITPQDIICSQKANGINLKAEDIVVSNVKIDLTRGKHNPLERYQNNALVFGDFHKTLVHWLDTEVVVTFLHGYVTSISFFKDYYSEEKFNITDDRISHLLPACCQDRIVRVYAKKPELVEAVSEAFENLQLKMYGVKTQVHETPEKKKRRT
ncbi:hypothetical protein ZIOFF_008291 [Zingiber officinale]|uniref:Uncharacterized protein n=1 Tax=Zingiber officinale TaxID=94328 RepID=A0A8J5IFB3_ZINOF|nr:hypothetical protein ZIOFF_008291 [Zingiber officinale]